jgi:ADP-ribosylglycohydrolase
MAEGSERLRHVRRSLEGLALGDAIGQSLLTAPALTPEFRPAPWRYSDDTEMAFAVVAVLARHGRIDRDALAHLFARRFAADPDRGYGAGSFWLLSQIGAGVPWQDASTELFSGKGSSGNGGAMRAAPLGAYFADDLDRVTVEARSSAEVTHAHPDGQAGAVAVALAAALAINEPGAGLEAIGTIASRLQPGSIRTMLLRAAGMEDASPAEAGAVLGTGLHVRADDTVPFSLWCAFRHLRDFRAAQLAAIGGFDSPASDRDTVCAIVGGIVGAVCPPETIPAEWQSSREPFPGDVEALFREGF